jgi:hypothetical protein
MVFENGLNLSSKSLKMSKVTLAEIAKGIKRGTQIPMRTGLPIVTSGVFFVVLQVCWKTLEHFLHKAIK